MKETERMEKILNGYLAQQEAARNVQTKADALLLVREHLTNMNYYADYEYKQKALSAEDSEK